MARIGYALVSSSDQDLTQRSRLKAAELTRRWQV
jgi:hypothetical protein